MTEGLTLKWGTLKAWNFDEGSPAHEAFRRYRQLGPVSAGAMSRHDTQEQTNAICDIIDALDNDLVYLDWDNRDVSKDEAKKYIREYRVGRPA